jgi:hypothetical protein
MNYRIIGLVICILPFIYVGSYLLLSVKGRCVPGMTGLRGVKWYDWDLPIIGNHDATVRILSRVYKPIIYIDCNYIHRDFTSHMEWKWM